MHNKLTENGVGLPTRNNNGICITSVQEVWRLYHNYNWTNRQKSLTTRSGIRVISLWGLNVIGLTYPLHANNNMRVIQISKQCGRAGLCIETLIIVAQKLKREILWYVSWLIRGGTLIVSWQFLQRGRLEQGMCLTESEQPRLVLPRELSRTNLSSDLLSHTYLCVVFC